MQDREHQKSILEMLEGIERSTSAIRRLVEARWEPDEYELAHATRCIRAELARCEESGQSFSKVHVIKRYRDESVYSLGMAQRIVTFALREFRAAAGGVE